MGTKLFNYYIDDMPKIPDVETGVYADDRVYFTSSVRNETIVERLNEQLKAASDWCKKWRIKINAKKSYH